ncbi:hypothetical protein [Psychrobacter sanguinis]|nr:hypothetical protein [Psychrobacter sanguinis]
MNLSSPVKRYTIGTGTATGDILDESDNSEDPFVMAATLKAISQ